MVAKKAEEKAEVTEKREVEEGNKINVSTIDILLLK